MNCDDIDTRVTIIVRSLIHPDRKISAIKAVRTLHKHIARWDLGLKDAKHAVDALNNGGTICIRCEQRDETLVRALLSATGLSENRTVPEHNLYIS